MQKYICTVCDKKYSTQFAHIRTHQQSTVTKDILVVSVIIRQLRGGGLEAQTDWVRGMRFHCYQCD